MSLPMVAVLCSFSRTKCASQGEAGITHEVRITFRLRNTSFQKRKSSPMDCFRFWLRRWDLKGALARYVAVRRSGSRSFGSLLWLHRSRKTTLSCFSLTNPLPPTAYGGRREWWFKSRPASKKKSNPIGLLSFCERAIKKMFSRFCVRDLNPCGHSAQSLLNLSVVSNPPINITLISSLDSTTTHSIIYLTMRSSYCIG